MSRDLSNGNLYNIQHACNVLGLEPLKWTSRERWTDMMYIIQKGEDEKGCDHEVDNSQCQPGYYLLGEK